LQEINNTVLNFASLKGVRVMRGVHAHATDITDITRLRKCIRSKLSFHYSCKFPQGISLLY